MDKEKLDKLMLAIRSGTDLETSCQYAGLQVQDVYRDLERGKSEAESISNGNDKKKSESAYLDLWEGLKTARADSIVRNIAAVQNAASGGAWQAAAWWLERAVPEQYSKASVERRAMGANTGRQISGG